MTAIFLAALAGSRPAPGSCETRILFAGKAHPRDEEGKRFIQRIVELRPVVRPEVEIVYLENYDWELARLLVAGVDVWVNTPQPPLEASGTSGMKAALNGVPSLSVLDGWWLEGWVENVSGWAIGELCPRCLGPCANRAARPAADWTSIGRRHRD